ncbi:4046_t:CDS:2 [Paraglomus occultum]|uniref:4046_t:CDS:1 n=1 Tax=Paraglomus occultum TaxID=144539 RepID=A0A9N9BC13_9GLOM|nr:4046_t:CDS:2 [Paraglomus occultum]
MMREAHKQKYKKTHDIGMNGARYINEGGEQDGGTRGGGTQDNEGGEQEGETQGDGTQGEELQGGEAQDGEQDAETPDEEAPDEEGHDAWKDYFLHVSDWDGEKDSDGYPEDGKTSESGRSTPVDETLVKSSLEDIALEVYAALYSKYGDKVGVVKKYYDSSAVFQDPLAIAEGHENIYLQFELLSSLVTDVTAQFLAVTVSPRRYMAAKQLVVIDAILSYHFPLSQKLSLRSTTVFIFDDERKIISHEDVWSVSDLIKNIPIIGWIYGNIGRKVSAVAINSLYSFCRGTVSRLSQKVEQ